MRHCKACSTITMNKDYCDKCRLNPVVMKYCSNCGDKFKEGEGFPKSKGVFECCCSEECWVEFLEYN
jgi:hypothetical protein